MDIISFIFYLGLINMIFRLISWIFALLVGLIFMALNHFDYGIRIIKVIGSYFLVALTTMLTLMALGDNPSKAMIIYYPLTGAIILFIGYVSNFYNSYHSASTASDWSAMRRLEQDSNFNTLLMIGSIALYIFSLFIPIIVVHGGTEWLFSIIIWTFYLPIIGWLIRIAGILFLFGIIIYGIIILPIIITSFSDRKKNNIPKTENQSIQSVLDTEVKDKNIENIYARYIDNNDFAGSLLKLDSLLNNQENNRLELLDAKAETLNRMNQLDEAIEIYEQILSEDKKYINAYICLIYIYQHKGIAENKKYSKEIIDIYKLLEKIDASKVSYNLLADALKDEGLLIEALECYKKAIQQNNQDNYLLESIYIEIAKIFFEQEKFMDALSAYNQAIDSSIADYGHDAYCSNIYAYQRGIYEKMKNWQKTREMDAKFLLTYNAYHNMQKATKKYIDKLEEELDQIIRTCDEEADRDRDNLSDLVILAIKDRYDGKKISYIRLIKIIDDILDDMKYEKYARFIEKAHLIARLSNHIK